MTTTMAVAVAAFLAGLIVAAWAVAFGMRRLTVVEHRSNYNCDDTVARMRNAVSDAMIKRGKPFRSVRRLVVFFLCKAQHAQKMIDAKPETASIMPRGWAVYERNGQTCLGTMNIPLMALPFKGIIRKAFSAVGREEEEILHKILD